VSNNYTFGDVNVYNSCIIKRLRVRVSRPEPTFKRCSFTIPSPLPATV